MMLDSWYVDVDSPKWVIGVTDGLTAFQLYIYSVLHNEKKSL